MAYPAGGYTADGRLYLVSRHRDYDLQVQVGSRDPVRQCSSNAP
ncbi:MAG: hypothetical protein QM765_41050 [Myxococcales bacterium]